MICIRSTSLSISLTQNPISQQNLETPGLPIYHRCSMTASLPVAKMPDRTFPLLPSHPYPLLFSEVSIFQIHESLSDSLTVFPSASFTLLRTISKNPLHCSPLMLFLLAFSCGSGFRRLGLQLIRPSATLRNSKLTQYHLKGHSLKSMWNKWRNVHFYWERVLLVCFGI